MIIKLIITKIHITAKGNCYVTPFSICCTYNTHTLLLFATHHQQQPYCIKTLEFIDIVFGLMSKTNTLCFALNNLIWNRIFACLTYFSDAWYSMLASILMLLKALYTICIPWFCIFYQILLIIIWFLASLTIVWINYFNAKLPCTIVRFGVLVDFPIPFASTLSVQTSTIK